MLLARASSKDDENALSVRSVEGYKKKHILPFALKEEGERRLMRPYCHAPVPFSTADT